MIEWKNDLSSFLEESVLRELLSQCEIKIMIIMLYPLRGMWYPDISIEL